MSRRHKLAITAAVGALVAIVFGADMFASLFAGAPTASTEGVGDRRGEGPLGAAPDPAGSPPVAAASPPAGGSPGSGRPSGPGGHLLSYALSLDQLSGLSPDSAPGTRLQLWVAWEPPLTPRPRIDLLIEEAVLERIVEGLTPRTPATALVLVEPSAIRDLLYADRYGQLNAVTLRSP
jgi:hypothetical protein